MKTRRELIQPPWMDGDVKKAIEKKREAWKTWKRNGTRRNKEEYKKRVTEVNKKTRNKKNALERKVAKCRKEDSKIYYAFINRARKTWTKIGPLTNEMGEQISDAREQVEVLNNYLATTNVERRNC